MSAAALSFLRGLPDPFPGSAFRRTGAALVLAAFGGPFWNVILVSLPGASLTVGRALIVLAAVLLALELRRAPQPLARVAGAVWLLLGAVALLWAWTVVNALLWGCRCGGEVAGFSELVAVVALAAFAATFEPRLRPALLLAVIGGALLTALLTLGGVHGLSAGTRNPVSDVDRLAGPYGNANFLAFALAFALPAGIAAYRACAYRMRLLLGLVLALVGLVVLLTYSRAGLLAAAAGIAVVLVLGQRRGSGAQWRVVAGIALAGIAAAIAYPLFAEQRREATSSKLEAELRAQDRSGWDGRTQGLIPGEPTRMRNPAPGVLEVRADGPGRGVSRPLERAGVGDAYELRLRARAVAGSQPLRLGLEDNLLGNGAAQAATTLGAAWRELRLRWEPTADSRSPRLYLWTPVAGPGFQVRDVVTVARSPGEAPVATAISATLEGNRFADLEAERARVDARDIRSRRVGADLALTAFASEPVRGIGWGRFPQFSGERSEFRGLPTHNEYLRFLAELGAVGAWLLALTALAIGSSFWRRRLDVMSLALLGLLVTGAVGLAFVNALGAGAIAIPLALAAALAAARAGPREIAARDEASAWWVPEAGGRPGVKQDIEIALGAGRRAWSALRVSLPLERLRQTAPAPAAAPLGGRAGQLARRLSAAAPRPATLAYGAPAQSVVAGVGRMRRLAPAIAPEGWASWLRGAERDVRGAARGARDVLRVEGNRALRARGAVAIGVGSRTLWAVGVGAVALAVRMPLMFERHEVLPGGDSTEYVHLARSFFDQDAVSAVRPPGYPAYLALAGLLPGRLEDAAVVVQLLLGTGMCAALVFFAWPLFGRLAAVVAGLLLALTAPSLSVEAVLLADALFGVLVTVVAGLLAAAAIDERRRMRWLLGAAIAIAVAAYVKPVGHALVLAPLLPLALATRSWRAALRGFGVVFAVVALLTVPWMARNDARHGSFTMSEQTGTTLFNRAFERDRLAIPAGSEVAGIAAALEREHPDRRLATGVADELLRRGDTLPEVQRKMRAAALEAIRRSPGAFAVGTLRSTHDVVGDVAGGGGTDEITTFVMRGEPIPRTTRLGLSAAEPLRTLWRVFALFGLAAALWLASRSRRTRLAAAAALAVWGTVAVATAALHGGQLRSSASLAPLTFLLGAAGLAVACKVGLQLLGVGAGAPRPPVGALLRDGATPSGHRDTEGGSAAG